MYQLLTSVPRFLREPASFLEEVRREEGIGSKIRASAVSSVLFLAAYGFVTGLSHSLAQAAASAVKMPILFLATILFSLPAYHAFSLVLGTRLNLKQVIAILLVSISVTAFLLLGLSPVTLFFVFTSRNYPFFQLLAVAFVGLSGTTGLHFLSRSMSFVDSPTGGRQAGVRRVLLGAWFVLYAVIASQMTWRLSPFVGNPERPFVLLEPSRDNFYVDALHALLAVLGMGSSSDAGNVQATFGSGATVCVVVFLLLIGIGLALLVDRQAKERTASQQKEDTH